MYQMSISSHDTLQWSLTTVPFTIDNETTIMKCITTEHGDCLVSGIDYVTGFVGCTPEDASKKLSYLYNSYPMLRPHKRELRHYSKGTLKFMSYLHKKKIFMTLAGIKVFTKAIRAGKLAKNAYPDQDVQVVKKTINRRRQMAIDMMTTLMQSSVGTVDGEDDVIDDESSVHSHESDSRFIALQQENKRLLEENDDLRERLMKTNLD